MLELLDRERDGESARLLLLPAPPCIGMPSPTANATRMVASPMRVPSSCEQVGVAR